MREAIRTRPRDGVVLALVVVVGFGSAACGGAGGDGAATEETGAETTPEPASEAPAAAEVDLPEGMTAEMVTQGKQIFGGAGICFTCHGPSGEGMPNLGANLTDGQWLHSDGSYEGIGARERACACAGVPADKSTSGSPMVARGGTNLPDDQIAAVAAYVWTLSR